MQKSVVPMVQWIEISPSALGVLGSIPGTAYVFRRAFMGPSI